MDLFRVSFLKVEQRQTRLGIKISVCNALNASCVNSAVNLLAHLYHVLYCICQYVIVVTIKKRFKKKNLINEFTLQTSVTEKDILSL